jgi:hypothetical protein
VSSTAERQRGQYMQLAGAGAHFLLFDHALISDSLMARPAVHLREGRREKGGGLGREDQWEANREKGRAMERRKQCRCRICEHSEYSHKASTLHDRAS